MDEFGRFSRSFVSRFREDDRSLKEAWSSVMPTIQILPIERCVLWKAGGRRAASSREKEEVSPFLSRFWLVARPRNRLHWPRGWIRVLFTSWNFWRCFVNLKILIPQIHSVLIYCNKCSRNYLRNFMSQVPCCSLVRRDPQSGSQVLFPSQGKGPGNEVASRRHFFLLHDMAWLPSK